MPELKTDLQLLLKNIQEGLKSYSIEELNSAITEVLNKKHDKFEEINFVLDTVAKDYSISRRTLVHSHARGDKQQARVIAYCLLHFELQLPIRFIAKRVFANKWHNSVGKGISYYKSLNPKVKVDREFQEKYGQLQKLLAEYIGEKHPPVQIKNSEEQKEN